MQAYKQKWKAEVLDAPDMAVVVATAGRLSALGGADMELVTQKTIERLKFARYAIRNAPSYADLVAANTRFIKSIYKGAEAEARIERDTQKCEVLLVAHSGVLHARSQRAQVLSDLANRVFHETGLPRKPKGVYRGEEGLDLGRVKVPRFNMLDLLTAELDGFAPNPAQARYLEGFALDETGRGGGKTWARIHRALAWALSGNDAVFVSDTPSAQEHAIGIALAAVMKDGSHNDWLFVRSKRVLSIPGRGRIYFSQDSADLLERWRGVNNAEFIYDKF